MRRDRGHSATPRDEALTWPPGVAVGLAFGGLYMAVAGFSAGLIPVGILGLLVLGLAPGVLGSLRRRLLLAFGLWLVMLGLIAISATFGEVGYAVLVPVIFCLLFVALGQGLGLVAGALLRRPRAEPGEGADT